MSDHAAAQERLNQAIQDFYAETEPDTYIHDWVLVTNKHCKNEDGEYKPFVGVRESDKDNWVKTIGMLDIAINWRRSH